MASTITIPAKGAADPEVIALATQLVAEIAALPAGTAGYATLEGYTQPDEEATVEVAYSGLAPYTDARVIATAGAELIGVYSVTAVTESTLTLTCQGTGSVDSGNPVSAGAALVIMGEAGSNGSNGAAGQSAKTLTTSTFTQPAANATVTVAVDSSSWTAVGAIVFESSGGYYEVTAIPDATHFTLRNLGYPGFTAPGGTLGGLFVPAGIRGAVGPDTFVAGDPNDWDGDAPTTLSAAINRLAAAMGSPVP